MTGDYKVKIRSVEDGYYIAHVTLPNGREYLTQGTEKDIFFMAGDLLSCCYNIELSWWKNLLIKIFKLH